jgi:hypothetical protein
MLAKKYQGTRKKEEKTGGCLPKAKANQERVGERFFLLLLPKKSLQSKMNQNVPMKNLEDVS